MKQCLLPALLLGLLLVLHGEAGSPDAQQAKAIAVIEKYGGKVGFDEKRPDRPVVSVQITNADLDDVALSQLSVLTQLRELDLNGTKVTDAGLDHLKGFPELQVLDVGAAYITDEGLPRIKALPQLRGLSLSLSNVSESGVAHLKRLTRLQTLDLGMTYVGDDGLEHLESLTGLRVLGLCNAEITDIGLAHLKGLTRLQGLYLGGNKISDAGLEHLSGLRQLRILSLQSNDISDAGLMHLQGLTQLEELNLSENGIRGSGLVRLKGLGQLQSLDLHNTRVRDGALESLQGLTQLRSLNLAGTRITEASVPHLKRLVGLKELDLSRTNVSDAGAKDLRTALPHAHVTLGPPLADIFGQPVVRAAPKSTAAPQRRPGVADAPADSDAVIYVALDEASGMQLADDEEIDFSKFGDITAEWKSFGIFGVYSMSMDEAMELQKNLVEQAKIQGKSVQQVSAEFGKKVCAEIRERAKTEKKSPAQYVQEQMRRRRILEQVIGHRAEPLFEGKFTIGGTVVDQDGKPLADVTVRVEKSKMYREDRVGAAQFKIASPFEFKVDGGSKLWLTFKKAGYYPVDDQTLAVPEPKRTDTPEVLANTLVARPVVEKRDLRIVLEKQGQLVRLQDHYATLEFSADGSGVVLDLDRPQRTLAADPPERKVGKLQDSRQLPANCIHLLADLDKDGRIALESVKSVEQGGPYSVGTNGRLPATVRLVASGTDSGFILTTPSNPFRPFRKMKEAPQQGYQREIVFRASTLVRQNGFVFYCRVNSKYGKGQIFDIQRSGQGDARLVAHVVVWLQPDGSRNLETMQCWW